MAVTTQLHSIVKKGKYGTDEVSKKLAIVAVDWDVEIQFQQTAPGATDFKFTTVASVKLKRDTLDKVAQALFVPLVRDLKKIAFEGKKETQSKVIRDAFIETYVDKLPYLLRVVAYLKIEQKDGKTYPTRSSKLELYKLNSFEELNALKKSINYDTKVFEGFKQYTPLGTFEFNPWSFGSGTWTSHDQLDVDAIAKVLSDCQFGHNYSYGKHLDRVFEALGSTEKPSYESTASHQNSTPAPTPINATFVDNPIPDDEFPF